MWQSTIALQIFDINVLPVIVQLSVVCFARISLWQESEASELMPMCYSIWHTMLRPWLFTSSWECRSCSVPTWSGLRTHYITKWPTSACHISCRNVFDVYDPTFAWSGRCGKKSLAPRPEGLSNAKIIKSSNQYILLALAMNLLKKLLHYQINMRRICDPAEDHMTGLLAMSWIGIMCTMWLNLE